MKNVRVCRQEGMKVCGSVRGCEGFVTRYLIVDVI